MQRKLLARGRQCRGSGEINLDERECVGQDGIMSRQTVPSNLSSALAELGSQRAERIASQLSIEVCGFDRCGRFFTERSETCDVSDAGCKFYLRTEVEREAVVALRVIKRSDRRRSVAAPVLFQVAHMERGSSGWTLGAWKLRAEDSWPVPGVPARDGAASFE
jgi:hypothetical protein